MGLLVMISERWNDDHEGTEYYGDSGVHAEICGVWRLYDEWIGKEHNFLVFCCCRCTRVIGMLASKDYEIDL